MLTCTTQATATCAQVYILTCTTQVTATCTQVYMLTCTTQPLPVLTATCSQMYMLTCTQVYTVTCTSQLTATNTQMCTPSCIAHLGNRYLFQAYLWEKLRAITGKRKPHADRNTTCTNDYDEIAQSICNQRVLYSFTVQCEGVQLLRPGQYVTLKTKRRKADVVRVKMSKCDVEQIVALQGKSHECVSGIDVQPNCVNDTWHTCRYHSLALYLDYFSCELNTSFKLVRKVDYNTIARRMDSFCYRFRTCFT